jgi:Rrf2 family protein
MIYSKTCEYALRALSYLASTEKGTLTMIPEVSCKTGVPAPYIAKVFQSLVRSGILESQRGPTGGFAFKRPPETITLFEIIQTIDDVTAFVNQCVMGLDKCSSANACPLHFIWTRTKKQILNKLRTSTFKQVTKKIGKVKYRELKRSRLNEALQLNVCK